MSARILVVDDIEANVRLLEAKLTAEYYEVLTASDGPTALAIAASERPDIVLLDVMIPGMDGFDADRRRDAVGPCARPHPPEDRDRRSARPRGLGPPHGRDRRRRLAPCRLGRP